jgi:hypothetical protein
MAGATGLEPATSGVTGRRSNQLSYAPTMTRSVAFAVGPEIREPPDQVKVAPFAAGGARREARDLPRAAAKMPVLPRKFRPSSQDCTKNRGKLGFFALTCPDLP